MKGKDPQGVECLHPLSESDFEKDLGVLVDKDLNFKNHVAYITANANKILGVIRRTFDHLTPETFISLYKSLVRPTLEYGHSVWQPRHKTLCADIEDVQRRATRLIGSFEEHSYPDRLRALKLPSLEHRRTRGDMIDTYKNMSTGYMTQIDLFS